MEEFDDEDDLSKSENGSLLLQLIQVNTKLEYPCKKNDFFGPQQSSNL